MDAGPPGPAPDARRRRLALECALLFGGLPAALAGSTLAGFRINPLLPLLLAAGTVTVLLLRDPSFDRARFRLPATGTLRAGMRVVRFLISAAILAAGLWFWAPDRLLALPRWRSPPLGRRLRALPAGFRRAAGPALPRLLPPPLRPLFGGSLRLALAGTLAFSWAHIVFLNPVALLLTLAGGWFFARTYSGIPLRPRRQPGAAPPMATWSSPSAGVVPGREPPRP
ncbi:MAG: hypothetical protein U1F77_01325 [Kiritimatiellia bacterium]